MTLHTRVMVTSQGIDPRATFEKCRDLIGAPDDYRWWESPDPTSDSEYRHTMAPGYHAEIDQGLPALLWINHWNGDLEPEHVHDEWCHVWDDDGPTDVLEDHPHEPRGYVEINFDTAYGYTADNGASCSDLHAWLVQEIGAWLTEQGATWEWYDESGDGWNHGQGWGTLGSPEVGQPGSTIQRAGRDEKRDFGALVMLAVAAEIAEGGAR